MALTATEIANTTAAAFNVEYRVFRGPRWSVLKAAGVAASLAAWTAPDTGLPTGWTEITTTTYFGGSVDWERQGNSVIWHASISGQQDVGWLEIGQAVAVWSRYYTGTTWQSWFRELVGQVIETEDTDDWRNAREWRRRITGMNATLDRVDGPRMVAGPVDLTQLPGTTVQASTALADPALLQDAGEFRGVVASVEAGNLIDGRRETVYVADTAPSSTAYTVSAVAAGGALAVSELFMHPRAGAALSRSWWIEIHNHANEAQPVTLYCQNNAGHVEDVNGNVYTLTSDGQQLPPGAFCVFAADGEWFERDWGGAPGAAFVVDCSRHNPSGYIPNQTDGCIMPGGSHEGTLAWAPAGAARKFRGTYGEYSGDAWCDGTGSHAPKATVNSSNFATGKSIRRDLSQWVSVTGDDDDSPPASWFSLETFPSPGGASIPNVPVFMQVSLPDNVCTLDGVTLTAASTRVKLNNYLGWLPAGQGIAETFIFNYSGSDANGLILTSWVNAPPGTIVAGTRVYPYAYSHTLAGGWELVAQTGYPVHESEIVRARMPYIANARVFWSPLASARTLADVDWANDYHGNYHNIIGNGADVIVSHIGGYSDGAYAWVRHAMYIIDAMQGAGYGRANEIRVKLAQAALDWSGLPDVNGATSYALAQRLCTAYGGIAAGDIADGTAGTGLHELGQHSLAIAPLSSVLDDLAGATGCVIVYGTDGGVRWDSDAYWPFYTPEALYLFSQDDVRGALQWSDAPQTLDYIIVNARVAQPDGSWREERYIYPSPGITDGVQSEPPTGAQATEISGYVLPAASYLRPLAIRQAIMRLHQRRAALTVAGIGEWLRPNQVVITSWPEKGGSAITRYWVVEQVSRQAQASVDGGRYFSTAIELREFSFQVVWAG